MDLTSAENTLQEWTVAANALALLRAVYTSGLYEYLRNPITPAEVAARLGIDPQQTEHVCMALEALQVLRRNGSTYQLTEGWAMVGAEDRPAALGDRLATTQLLQQAIAGCFTPPPGFDAVPAEEAVALARSAWGEPNSPVALQSWAALDASMPEVRAVWEAGARHAEFGCGAGRDLLRVVVMYPNVSAVGYEILPYVAELARQQAVSLGIEDRVEVRCENVQSATAQAEFDTIVWSQMFFLPESRPATIASIKRALKPGGLLVMVLMPDLPDPEGIEPTLPVRAQMLVSVAYPRWSIYWPQSVKVRDELERAGFVHLHTIPHPRTTYLVMRLPE
jgi:SAM-dependent methyltransferase